MRQTKQQLHALASATLGLLIGTGGMGFFGEVAAVAAPPAKAAKPAVASRSKSAAAKPRVTVARRGKAGVRRRATGRRYAKYRSKGRTTPAVAANGIRVASVTPVANSGTRIILEGNRPFQPQVRTSGSPSATIITVDGTLGGAAGYKSLRQNGVWNVRYGNVAGGKVQIVANTRAALPNTAQSSPDGKRWEIVLWASGATPAAVQVASAASSTPVVTSAAAPVSAPIAKSIAPAAPVGGPYPALLNKATVAAVAAAPQQKAPAATSAAATDVMGEDRRVSLDFVAADINDVLKALSLQSGINIVTGTDVKGNITVALKRVSLPEALDMVTRLSGFQYARFGSAYVVGTPASVAAITAGGTKTADVPVTEFIRYRYTPQAQLYRVLAERFPGLRLPEADKDGDSPAVAKLLVLTDTRERVEAIRGLVERMEQAVSVPSVNSSTEVYRIKYANPTDLVTIVSRLVPTISIQVGPAQAFQGVSGSGSASFSSGGSYGGGAGGAGGGGGAAAGAGGGANLGAGTGGAGASNSVSPTAANTLLLTGAASDIARAREVLNQIDVKAAQIIYEARVVDINNEDLQKLGLRYDLTRPVQIGERNPAAAGTPPYIGNTAQEYPGNVNFGAIYRSPYSVGVQLDALANNNRARTLANPNLAALDGQPAAAFIGDQVKYVIAVQQTQQGQTIQTETATVGITLKVTGKSSPDGTVTLYVHPEVSTITSFLSLANGISLPQISTRYVDTTIRVKDGETIAIGGLIREQDIKNLQKVPLLGDLPFFGQLFRYSDKQKRRSELVIFVTARISKD